MQSHGYARSTGCSIAFTGVETKDVNVRAGTFSALHWGAWVIDGNGKPASPDPLFVIGADQ